MSLPQQAPAKGSWLGVLALVLGLVGVVVTFLPMDLTGVRAYLACAFGLPAFVIGIAGLLGPRKGKVMAGIGVVLSLLALLIGGIAIANVIGWL